MNPLAASKPLPRINPDNQPFWDYCRRHELRFQKCLACGHTRFPASILCPRCYSREARWILSEGQGTVYTYAVYHKAFHPAYADELPYVTAVVALSEGPHLLTNIVGCLPKEVYCDMPVTLVWEDIDGSFSLPKFKPVRQDAR